MSRTKSNGGAVADLEEEYSLSDLRTTKFKPLNWVVDGIIAEGLTILAAKPKLGKSWMMLDVAIAVASGGKALTNIECDEAVVLYYALEDNQRRLKRRARKLLKGGRDWPEHLYIRHMLDRIDKNGLDDIRDWIEEREADLVIIDTYNHIRPPRKGNEEAYATDYAWLQKLQRLAHELRVAIVVVHHVRKAQSDDPMDGITGTTGLQAAVDTMLVLMRDSEGIVLHGRGKDLEDEIEQAVSFNRETCRWQVLGPADEVRRSPERTAILKVLHKAGKPIGPTVIANALDKKVGSVTKMLFDMSKAGEVQKTDRGLYTCP